MNRNILATAVLAILAALASCGPVPHPFSAPTESNPLVEDRRVTSSVQLVPVAPYPGLAEAVVKNLARQDILATTRDAGPRKVLIKGAVENGALVWRAVLPDNTELGAVSQPLPPGSDSPAIARAATPLIVGLLTASGTAADTSTRPHVAVHLAHGPQNMDLRSLSQAMADALVGQGVAIGNDKPVAAIDGDVRVTPGKGGQDLLQIDWTVRDAKGAALGTVSQGSPVDRQILAGSLLGLAHDIAGAAAPGIVDVIRRKLPGALNPS